MIAEIEVIQPGLYSTIQDLGRYGFMKFGVPLSGAMDTYSAKMVNLLLRNKGDAAVMEITQMGPELKFNGAAQIAISGAELSPRINKSLISNNVVYELKEGDVLSFGKRASGCRAYLGILGGFLVDEVLKSKSWFEGITDHYRLKKGMFLTYESASGEKPNTHTSLKIKIDHLTHNVLQVYPGPEFNFLNQEQRQLLLSSDFRIDRNNNRMAIQLTETLPNDISPILTGPVTPGTVQLTPSGKIIVLMRDCQTTGGYPRILQLRENAINLISQKVSGDRISFVILDR